MPLEEYKRRRDFSATPEPTGGRTPRAKGQLSYVVQEHAATAHHYDFRLELDGVLLSWAVPKGPSFDPHDKRLAVRTEDHPLDYATFEGTIPKPEYGAGTVIVWDHGTWEPIGDAHAGLEKGEMKFHLSGEKLHGRWVLIRLKRGDEKRENWLLIKERDDEAVDGGEPVTTAEPRSVLSQRTLPQVAEEEASKPAMATPAAAESRAQSAPAMAPAAEIGETGAKEAPMPRSISFELARLVDHVPRSDGWVAEVKYDGYRAAIFLENGSARALSRSGADWSDKFGHVVQAAQSLPAASAILDGEVIVLDDEGVSRFQLLQDAIGRAPDKLAYAAFDLLYLNGYDLRDVPLLGRKELLAELLKDRSAGDPIRYSEHLEGSSQDFHERACELELEGSMFKRADSRYLGKRDGSWVKVKCRFEQEFVVGGFTEPHGSRTGFGALLLGYYDGKKLVYAGRAGTGFTEARLAELHERLSKHTRATPPFASPPRGDHVTWVRPELVVQVAFQEWTSDGILRQPAFLGVREDKTPHEVVREVTKPAEITEAELEEDAEVASVTSEAREEGDRKQSAGREKVIAGVRISNPQKKLLPKSDVTKLDLARYYEHIAPHMLPYVAERPLTLVRCPSGTEGDCFYQRHPDMGLQKDVHTHQFEIPGWRSESDLWLYVDSPPGLVSLAQMGVGEIHTWGSTIDTIRQPDRLVFDLDPGPDLPWDTIRSVAHHTRELLEKLGFTVFIKTTGGKGLHVVVPIEPVYDFERMRAFAKAVVDSLVGSHGDIIHGRMAKSERIGKVFIDYLRNGLGASAVAPYSTRARDGAPVAVPIRWDELTPKLDPQAFTIDRVIRRVGALKEDPWAEMPERQASSRTLRAAFSAIS
ncbi:MAG: DNA ligase D [Coriobacteriales bacterium]|nr:DNA ligase D [Coriobacteriales bacterium]